MSNTHIGTDSTKRDPFTKLLAANSAATAFSIDPISTTRYAVSATQGIIELPDTGNNLVLLVPFGSGAENDTFDLKIWGERNTDGSSGASILYMAVPLITVTCTLSATVGTAGFELINTDRVCDTIVFSSGTPTYEIISPTGDEVASMIIDAKGFSRLIVQTDRISGTASGNALHAMY